MNDDQYKVDLHSKNLMQIVASHEIKSLQTKFLKKNCKNINQDKIKRVVSKSYLGLQKKQQEYLCYSNKLRI